MGLLSFFKRGAKAPAAKPVADSADAVQTLRVRARRRLIGAAVLVGLGVVGFPLVFETQPRPIPVDLPIDIPSKDKVPALVIPPAASQVAAAEDAAASQPESQAQQQQQQPSPSQQQAKPQFQTQMQPDTSVATQAQAQAQAVAPAAPAFVPPVPSTKSPAEKSSARAADKPLEKAKPDVKAAGGTTVGSATEAARVQSLLDGKPSAKAVEAPTAAASVSGRFIVQFGAYADAKSAHDARMKVERLGIKTYAQEVQTADGKRIRVRIGPYASRDEADKAAARVRSTGLSTAVLTI